MLGTGSSPATASNRIAPTDPEVRATERARATTGRSTSVALMAVPGSLDLAGRSRQTWLYNGGVGQEMRLTAGDELRARLTDRLASPTTVHWHGLALRDDMDGVSMSLPRRSRRAPRSSTSSAPQILARTGSTRMSEPISPPA